MLGLGLGIVICLGLGIVLGLSFGILWDIQLRAVLGLRLGDASWV